MEKMKTYDCHTHSDLNWEMVPPEIYIKRRKWDLNLFEKTILKWGQKHPLAVLLLLGVYNVFSIFAGFFRSGEGKARTVHARELLNVYFSRDPRRKLLKQMNSAGIDRAITLHIDHRWQDSGLDGLDRYNAAYTYNQETAGGRLIPTQGISRLDDNTTINPYAITKIYPALLPDEETLLRILNTVDKAIIHTSSGGIGDNTHLNHPGVAAKALETNPELVICYAHFGGGKKAWRNAILRLMAEYKKPDGTPRVYACFSFNEDVVFNPEKFFSWIKAVLDDPLTGDCILFGSDWPLHTFFYTYKDFVDACRKHLGPVMWLLIAHYNPETFLEK